MNIGLIGAGRMGSGVALRLVQGGHRVVVYNRTYAKTEELIAQGTEGVHTVEELVAALPAPRVIWLYLPAGEVTAWHLAELRGLLSAGDILIDGGNSHFTDTLKEAAEAKAHDLHWVDVGTSGGLGGASAGYCLMIGAEPAVFEDLQPLWQAVAQADGYVLAGPAGAGHYTKMIHNGIEYGMLQAYAEGLALLEADYFAEQVNIPAVAKVWQHGSIIESRIGGWMLEALEHPEQIEEAHLEIAENGESRWALEAAIEQKIATPVLAAALFSRFSSQHQHPHASQIINAIRNLFGGHNL